MKLRMQTANTSFFIVMCCIHQIIPWLQSLQMKIFQHIRIRNSVTKLLAMNIPDAPYPPIIDSTAQAMYITVPNIMQLRNLPICSGSILAQTNDSQIPFTPMKRMQRQYEERPVIAAYVAQLSPQRRLSRLQEYKVPNRKRIVPKTIKIFNSIYRTNFTSWLFLDLAKMLQAISSSGWKMNLAIIDPRLLTRLNTLKICTSLTITITIFSTSCMMSLMKFTRVNCFTNYFSYADMYSPDGGSLESFKLDGSNAMPNTISTKENVIWDIPKMRTPYFQNRFRYTATHITTLLIKRHIISI